MREYVIALFRVSIPYMIIGALSFWAGIWVQSGQTPAVPKTVTKYIPSPKGYIDLPEIKATPSVHWIITKNKTDTVTRTDTIHVPVSWGHKYELVEDKPLSLNADHVFLETYNPRSNQFQIQEFNIPDPTWDIIVTGTIGINPFTVEYTPVMDLSGQIIYQQFSGKATIIASSFNSPPIALIGVGFNFWRATK